MKYQNAKNFRPAWNGKIIIWIVITGKGDKGESGYMWLDYHPHAWLINQAYREMPKFDVGDVHFIIFDYPPFSSIQTYANIVDAVMSHEGLNQS